MPRPARERLSADADCSVRADARFATLAERFAEPVIIEHGGGHVIPDDPAITMRIAGFVAHHRRITTP